MDEQEESRAPDWDLEEWEEALTIRTGSAYVCRTCGNVVMVTKGGVGILDLACCGQPMEGIRKTTGAGGQKP